MGGAPPHEVEPTGVRLVITRTGQVLSTAGGLLEELLPPFRLGVGGPLAGGNQYLAWIHIDDEIGILLWALDDENVSGTINATAPNPATNKEFSKALGRALDRPAVMPVPGLVLDAQIRPRVRPGPARRRTGDPKAHARARLPVQLSRPRRSSAGPSLTSEREGQGGPSPDTQHRAIGEMCWRGATLPLPQPTSLKSPAQARPRAPRSRSARCPPGARPGSRAGAP